MSKHRRSIVRVVVTLLAFSGCGGADDAPDAAADAGSVDGGAIRIDAGADVDSGVDAGAIADGGRGTDAGDFDAGPPLGVCTMPLVLCGTECVDLSSSAVHCGACDSPC